MSKAPTPLATRIAKMKEIAAEFRESTAAELLALARVEQDIGAEAVKGYTTLTIRPPKALNLAGTKAARELVKQLTAAGVRCEWQPNRPNGPDGPVVQVLVLDWS